MLKPIYASRKHEVIIEPYIMLTKDFIKDISNETRYNNFLDVLEIVIEYHNNYGKGVRGDNYWDWLMILPINLNVLTSGFLAAIEDDVNGGTVRAYKLLLTDMVHEVVQKIENLEPQSE